MYARARACPIGALAGLDTSDGDDSGTRHAFDTSMKPLFLGALAIVAACNAGESRDTTKTVTDTTVTPAQRPMDTTVVQKKVDVSTDTVKKTHKKP
jgi:hypothetical protein